jgi:multidrug efflux system membrane fusion protein
MAPSSRTRIVKENNKVNSVIKGATGRNLLGVMLLAMLAACGKAPEKVEELRPVRAVVLAPQASSVIAEFPGEVRARIETRLGFRVPGKIITRKVEVGTTVKKGELLMQLDPQDLKLAQEQANAQLRAAESNLAMAKSDFARYQDLRQKNFVSAAVLEAKENAWKSAQASYEQARAGASNQLNQTGYANLVADSDGVVTAIEAEVGQVVAAGTPVLRIAKHGEREVVIGIPENQVGKLREVNDLRIHFWVNQQNEVRGRLRELSPIADAGTRTFIARITIIDPPPEVRLGMTASVAFVATNPQPVLKLPLSALLNEQGKTSVWVVENGAVKLVPVQLASAAGNELVVASGLNPGQTVVTAGVHLLKPGQKVKLLDADAGGASGSANAKPSPGTSK